MLYNILEDADNDSIVFSIVHNAGIYPPYPASETGYSDTILGRLAAPDNITVTPTLTATSYDGQIIIAGLFEYCIHGTSTWNSASGSVNNLGIGDYDVRYQAVANTSFSSRVTMVTVYSTGTIFVDGITELCYGINKVLTASTVGVTNSVFKWYSSQIEPSHFHTGVIYANSNLQADTTFYISVLETGYSETAAGDRKEVIVTVTPLSLVSASQTEICPCIKTHIFPNSGGIWTSSNSSIVDIINSSTIVGKSVSNATLTFYDSLTTCSASITVKPYPEPDDITGKSELTPNSVTVTGEKEGQSFIRYKVSDGVCETTRMFRVKVILVSNKSPKIIIGEER
ncbi:MAG: hypothetical protein LBG80_20100 [Bacteroidales bacterium]|nr:hypothetical protein [Bacteroidales bacterium]